MSDTSTTTKINYNDLLAEWIDSFSNGDYKRRPDGTFEWIDWTTWDGEDFDAFVKNRLSSQPTIIVQEKQR